MTVTSRRELALAAFRMLTIVAGLRLLDADEGLQITAVVTSQKYCFGQPTGIFPENVPPGAVSILMQVQLNYRNSTSQPLIVPKAGTLATVISPSLKDAEQRKHQIVIPPRGRVEFGDLRKDGIDLSAPDDRFFGVIPPGREKLWTTEHILIRVHDSGNVRMEWLGKTVFFQLAIDHRVLSKDLSGQLRTEWRRFGNLVTETVRTQPVEFSVPKSPEASACASPYRID